MNNSFRRIKLRQSTTLVCTLAALLLLPPARAQSSADLELSVAVAGQSDSQLVSVSVFNKGPDVAVNAMMQCELPRGTTVFGTLPAGCVLDTTSNIVSCTLASLARGDSATRSFQLDLRTGLLNANASSSTPDLSPGNNCGNVPIGPIKHSRTTGRIICPSGSPRGNCLIAIAFTATNGVVTVVTNATEADGTFAVVLPCATNQSAGEFVISAACCGSQVWRIPVAGCLGALGDLVCGDCLVRPGTIIGVKWIDLDHDGHQNGRERGLGGWTIYLEPGNVSIPTDAQGNYAFSNLAAGTYTVREMEHPDWEQSYPQAPATHTVTIEAGSGVGVGGINFGNWKKCATPPAGLSAWWPLDEPAGATFMADLAGANNHALPLPTGSVGPGSPLPVPGTVAGAKRFYSPLNVYGYVANAPEVNFGVGNFTIECWINPLAPPGQQQTIAPIVDKTQPTCPTFGYSLYVWDGFLCLFLADVVGNYQVYYSTLPIAYGVWQFVAVTVDRSGFVDFYIQGVPDLTFQPCMNPQSLDVADPLFIGGSRFLPPFSDILIDELEYFHRIVTTSELDAIFQAGRSGKCKRICGVKFNDLNGNGVRDFNEPGLPNWKIVAQGPVTASAITDANGNYCITNLPPGSYTVTEMLKLSWIQSAPAGGLHVVPLGPGIGVSAYNFGNYQRIFKDDVIYDPTGAASLVPTTNGAGVLVTNLGASSSDGVAVTFRPPANNDAWVLLDLSQMSTGATLRARWIGSYDGATGRELGDLRVTREGVAQYVLTSDLTALGSPPAMLKLYRHDEELVSANAPAEITAADRPVAFRARAGSIVLAALFNPDTVISLNGMDYVADEVRYVATPSGAVDYISSVQIMGSRLAAFTVPDAQGEPLLPRLDIVLVDGQVVLTWGLPGYRLQSATTLTEPISSTIWNDEAGQSPVALSKEDPRKFFRLVSLTP